MISQTHEIETQVDGLVNSTKVWHCLIPESLLSSYLMVNLFLLVNSFYQAILCFSQGMDSKVQNTMNDFLMLSNNQFIENVSTVSMMTAHDCWWQLVSSFALELWSTIVNYHVRGQTGKTIEHVY